MQHPNHHGESAADAGAAEPLDEPISEPVSAGVRSASRRDVIRVGTKLAFVAPLILTFSAREALAAGSNHSCYPVGHACPGNEPCCSGLTCNNGTCGDPCQGTGELCFAPSDCCSGACNLGSCQ